MMRAALFSLASVLVAMTPAFSQQKEANIKAGQEVGLFYVCKYNGGSASLSGTADNGSMRTTTEPSRQCGGKGEVTRIFYKPNAGFRGTDTAYIYYWGQRWDVRINVR